MNRWPDTQFHERLASWVCTGYPSIHLRRHEAIGEVSSLTMRPIAEVAGGSAIERTKYRRRAATALTCVPLSIQKRPSNGTSPL
jgi:hypothetical protein